MANNNGWTKFLLGIFWVIVVGFCGLCFWGYADAKSDTKRLFEKENSQDIIIATMVECSRGMREDMAEIKQILKRTSPYERIK